MLELRHLAVRCRDLDKARTFYEKGLGFAWVDYRPEGISMDLSDGHVNLTLLPFETQPAPPHEEGDEHIHFGVYVDSLEPIFKRLTDIGAHIVKEDVKQRLDYDRDTVPIGSFKVLDPDGNVVDITERPTEWRTSS